ncbi:helix-turn-helix domain-containing protein [Acidobacteriota bacterium]
MNNRAYKVEAIAEALDTSPAQVRNWIHQRRIKVIRLGRTVRIPATELEKILANGIPRLDEAQGSAS